MAGSTTEGDVYGAAAKSSFVEESSRRIVAVRVGALCWFKVLTEEVAALEDGIGVEVSRIRRRAVKI